MVFRANTDRDAAAKVFLIIVERVVTNGDDGSAIHRRA
jgi:hypothetical protein